MKQSEKKEIVGGSSGAGGMQWEEDAADLSSSSGHEHEHEHDEDSQQPKSHLTNGFQMSGVVESDEEEIRRVPEIGGESAGTSASCPVTGSTTAGPEPVNGTGGGEGRRKRGRSPADKESKRLKRLLRNRVSAQQARERKKAYLNDLETKVKDLEEKNAEFKERLSTLQNENQMLRQILKNTTASRRGGNSGANAE